MCFLNFVPLHAANPEGSPLTASNITEKRFTLESFAASSKAQAKIALLLLRDRYEYLREPYSKSLPVTLAVHMSLKWVQTALLWAQLWL